MCGNGGLSTQVMNLDEGGQAAEPAALKRKRADSAAVVAGGDDLSSATLAAVGGADGNSARGRGKIGALRRARRPAPPAGSLSERTPLPMACMLFRAPIAWQARPRAVAAGAPF